MGYSEFPDYVRKVLRLDDNDKEVEDEEPIWTVQSTEQLAPVAEDLTYTAMKLLVDADQTGTLFGEDPDAQMYFDGEMQ